MRIRKPLALVAFIILCEVAGLFGSVFTINSIPTWYAGLSKPAFTPPSWLFAPIWTTLYLLMGISAYLIYESRTRKRGARMALSVFGVQLALNVLWTLAFFGLRSTLLGFAMIVLLWIAIAATIIEFVRIRKDAALLLVPYIVWVTIAAFLNYFLLILNH
ncbi:TPA: tryptophan-rich sensory protein [Candidatus Micrarchaeota archaeon]|jgi:tryptophan-rich sensory protein|nr:tryptophan-rich sensory protein [Candidatus Micrarchaeota archaeon]HII10190.1 tryptophan-rich sensory protein [Candidatus Micrarchaeota archaeon]